MSIAVLIALQAEATAILADARFGWTKGADGVYRSTTTGEQVSLVLTGVGKVNATWGLARAYFSPAGGPTAEGGQSDGRPRDAKPGNGIFPRLVLSLGTSGALDATPVGTMVLCDEFVEHDMDVTVFGYPAGVTPRSLSPDPVYRPADPTEVSEIRVRLSEAGIPTIPGRELSGDLFLGDAVLAKQKRTLFGGGGAVLIDMECAAAAKICATAIKTPYLALRYVSDNADHKAGTSWDAEVGKAAVLFDKILNILVSNP